MTLEKEEGDEEEKGNYGLLTASEWYEKKLEKRINFVFPPVASQGTQQGRQAEQERGKRRGGEENRRVDQDC